MGSKVAYEAAKPDIPIEWKNLRTEHKSFRMADIRINTESYHKLPFNQLLKSVILVLRVRPLVITP